MDKNSTALESLILNKKDSINLKDCYSTAGIEEILTTLDQELIGLQDVKNRIREISSVLLLENIFMLNKIVGGVLSIPFLIIGAAFFLPNQTEVHRSIEIDTSPENIFNMVNNLEQWQRWSPWAEKDKNMQVQYIGPKSGVGATMTWQSENPQVGSGSQKIVISNPSSMVSINLTFEAQNDATAFFMIDSLDNNRSRITWSFVGQHGTNPVNRYMGLMFDTWVGQDYERGLLNLKALLESPKIELEGAESNTVGMRNE